MKRPWIDSHIAEHIDSLEQDFIGLDSSACSDVLTRLVEENRLIDQTCINLNPATNQPNPRAEALLASGLGNRPSLGYPGDKYETGLQAIEKIEVLADMLVREVFGADFCETRVASGAMANLYGFMACCKPGDSIIVPPSEIGGHVTHHQQGAAGLYGLDIHYAPVDASSHSVDIAGLRERAQRVKPKLISIGGSLNLLAHPVAEIRAIADEHGAKVHYDAAHLCGIIAGKAWQQPLQLGAHFMTFSTYKSLGGPASGAIVTNDGELAQKIEGIAYPGLTANFDVGKTAALALTMLDWRDFGEGYVSTMLQTAQRLAQELFDRGVAVYQPQQGLSTRSHQFALDARTFGGGHKMALHLEKARILTSAIGLPIDEVAGDDNGLRMGTPELVRLGMQADDMAVLADVIARVLVDGCAPESIADEVSQWRRGFTELHFVHK